MTAFRKGRLQGLSCLKGNFHEQFLGGWAGAIPPGYPAHAMPFGPTVPTLPHLSLCEYSHHLNKHCILILSGFTTETPKGVHCLK